MPATLARTRGCARTTALHGRRPSRVRRSDLGHLKTCHARRPSSHRARSPTMASMIGQLLHKDLEQLVREKKWDALREALSELPAADVAEIVDHMIDLPGADEAVLFRLLPREHAALVFSFLPLHRQR